MENGELPHDFDLVGEMVRDICYRNAVNYFGMNGD
jgi:glucuronate isomerase